MKKKREIIVEKIDENNLKKDKEKQQMFKEIIFQANGKII